MKNTIIIVLAYLCLLSTFCSWHWYTIAKKDHIEFARQEVAEADIRCAYQIQHLTDYRYKK
jgi:hypothetical protein